MAKKQSKGAAMVAKAKITFTKPETVEIKPAKKTAASELEWRALRPTELEAWRDNPDPEGKPVYLRIKQSVGKLGAADTFWYCYHGWKYVGTEKTVELAKSRCYSGRMRMPAAELGEWLERLKDELPPDLLESETARFEYWKKHGDHKKLTEPAPAPKHGEAGVEPRRKRGALDSGDAEVKEKKIKPEKVASSSSRPSQSAIVRVVKREPTGKPGTKWRARQEAVFALDGSTVAAVKDNDAVRHMLEDGTIKLEE